MRIDRLSAFCVNVVANALVVLIAPVLVIAWIVRVRTIEHLQRTRAKPQTHHASRRSQRKPQERVRMHKPSAAS